MTEKTQDTHEFIAETLAHIPRGEKLHNQSTVFGKCYSQEETQELTVKKFEMVQADQSYLTLRTAIEVYVTTAIQSGQQLFIRKNESYVGNETISHTPIAFELWRKALPEATQQAFDCDHCKSNWEKLFNIAVMDGAGEITFPAVRAFVASKADPIIAKVFADAPEGFEDYLNAVGNLPGRTYFPLSYIDLNLAEEVTSGKWNHFCAASNEDIQEYNDKHIDFNDFVYIDTLFGKFVQCDVVKLTKLFDYVKASWRINDAGAPVNAALLNSDTLLGFISNTQRLNKQNRMGAAYLWSCMQEKSNDWLRNTQSSMLGIVIDCHHEFKEDTSEECLTYIKNALVMLNSAENYNTMVAEDPQKSLEEAYNFLVANGLETTLRRRLLPLKEVKSVIWNHTDAVPLELDQVFHQLTAPKAATAPVNTLKPISYTVEAFINTIDTIRSIALSEQNWHGDGLMPIFFTDAIEGNAQPHDMLLNFDTRVGQFAVGLASPTELSYARIKSLASEQVGDNTPTNTTPIPVTTIFKSKSAAKANSDTDVNYILNIEHMAANFYQTVAGYGSCVLDSMVKNEYLGLAKPLVAMSRKFPMEGKLSKEAAGGVYLNPGIVFDVVYLNGDHACVTIATNSHKHFSTEVVSVTD